MFTDRTSSELDYPVTFPGTGISIFQQAELEFQPEELLHNSGYSLGQQDSMD